MSSYLTECLDLIAYVGPEWLQGLLEKYDEEVKAQSRWPTLLLNSEVRCKLWGLCMVLGVDKKGIPASACSLLERYLARHIQNYIREHSAEEWETYKQVLEVRLPLIMVSCIVLVGKMSSLDAPLSASTVHGKLNKRNIACTLRQIVAMESHVYRTLDYRIPLWSTLEITEFLMKTIGVQPDTMYRAAEHVVNVAEFHRHDMEGHLKSPTLPPEIVYRLSVYNLHFCAGAVSATITFMNYPFAESWSKLARLVRTNPAYIKKIANFIVKLLPTKENDGAKRRRLV